VGGPKGERRRYTDAYCVRKCWLFTARVFSQGILEGTTRGLTKCESPLYGKKPRGAIIRSRSLIAGVGKPCEALAEGPRLS